MTSQPTVDEMHRDILDILTRPEMEPWFFYDENVRNAVAANDADWLRLIHWYFTDYWASVPEELTLALGSIQRFMFSLRESRGYENVSQFFTVDTLRIIVDFGDTISAAGHNALDMDGYKEIVHELLVRPGIAPVIVHLVCERNITDWNDMAPLLDNMTTTESRPVVTGVL